MKRIIFAVIMALLFFAILNFVYCNLDDATFGYSIVFKFKIPYIMSSQTMPIPVGFVVLIAFCLGMVTIAILEALPSLFKTLELRSKNKKIRQLERELSLVRKMASKKAEKELKELEEEGDDEEEEEEEDEEDDEDEEEEEEDEDEEEEEEDDKKKKK